MAKGFYSKIYNIELEVFSEIVKTSTTYTEILRKCGFENKGCNINTLKRRLVFEKINTDHIQKGYGHNKGRMFFDKQISIEDAFKNYFVVSSKFRINTIKTLIHRFKLKEYKCNVCNKEAIWENKPLSLQIDHINGNRNDNRLENLRFLCPNCHSQTSTFAGKSTRKIYKCKECDVEIVKGSTFCTKCSGINKRKIERPSKEKLLELTKIMPMTKIGKMYGVSDNAVRKWIKTYFQI